MTLFSILLLIAIAVLVTVLIRLIVKEIKEHITKEADRIIQTLNSNRQWNQ